MDTYVCLFVCLFAAISLRAVRLRMRMLCVRRSVLAVVHACLAEFRVSD